jgi:hypothetical protein
MAMQTMQWYSSMVLFSSGKSNATSAQTWMTLGGFGFPTDWCRVHLEVVLGDLLFYLGTPPGPPALQDQRFVTKAPLGEDAGASAAPSPGLS